MIPPPPLLDAKRRELVEFQKDAIGIRRRPFGTEVVG